MEINNTNVSEFNSGLHSDSSLINQPKGSQRFALNTVNETDNGDEFFRSNEESNEKCISLKPDFIPIGKCYIGSNETIIFSVSKDNSISEIGILKNNCQYEVQVNDEFSSTADKLNFKIEHQIQATFRLRRGCERTIYFTDDYNKPRYYNLDKPLDFKNDNGTWAGRTFNLFKEYNSIPEFKSVQVLDSGGLLQPGSYNVSIQYLDEGLNPSEWIITSPIINIYNDLSTESFLDIQGSINSDTDFINFPVTTKSIKVEFDNLDESYAFYRLAFIEATTGTGNVTTVKYTDTISTSKQFFIYTGENAASTGTQEEILFFNDVIYRANSIEQIENRLLLANTEGKQTNFCKLQKYASRIKADVITKKVLTNQIIDPRNTKNPTVHFGDMITGGTGYMPGEIYSFGIVYVFKDGTLSPVFHIPGKNPTVGSAVFAPEKDANNNPITYPMDIVNESTNNRYIDNDNCSSNDYWGLDSEGIPLQNKPVRHHRFPLRSAINLPLVKEETNTGPQTAIYYKVKLFGTGTITLPKTCTTAELAATPPCVPISAPPFQVRVTYTVDGISETMTVNIIPGSTIGATSNPVNLAQYSNIYTSPSIVITKIEEADENGLITNVTTGVSPKGITYTASVVDASLTTEGKVYSTELLGIKFSGVDIPSLADTNGEEIIGYYIVRNERIENEKTILDTAVLVPTLQNSKYISHGLLNIEGASNRVDKKLFGIIHPEHKFNNKEYTSFDYIKQEGNFNILKTNKSKTLYNDVMDGSSYNADVHKEGNDDGHSAGDPDRGYDGWCLKIIFRDTFLGFVLKSLFNILKADIKEIFYLKALQSRDINDGANTAYNISCDNRIGMVQFKNDLPNADNKLPYVVLGKNILDSYSNFRTLPYYKESLNIEKFDNITKVGTSTIFNGDTYVCPMRYVNTVFWDNRLANRKGQTSVWNYIIGGLLVAIGAVLLIFGGSGSIVIGAGIAIIGGGALFVASGIEKDALVKAYNEEYARGLRQTALDDWTYSEYTYGNNGTATDDCGYDGPSDDEIQWIGDCLTDLWFESSVNISLRNKMVSDTPTFLDAPGIIETGNQLPENCWEFFGNHYWSSISRYPVSKLEYHLNKKLLVYNSKRRDSREYIGVGLGEYYQVNPDYHRINKQKIYYHLPLEYDCCSECQEDFPHRWHWSEQSFQEELIDNYRVFLPNNYKDLEGETGEITNVFKIGNNLFMHTLEALWQIPRNYQERVTDQIVSFIGTGTYGEIPAQKVLDDDTGSSAGSQHKWGLIKTPSGVFFPSENQRKIYQFEGGQLKPISSLGVGNWFQNNMELLLNKQYYNSTGKKYSYNDNPSNPFGTGFISTYDTKKERIIFTKKDFIFNSGVTDNPDFELCVNNGQMTYFPNFNQIIQTEQASGWSYEGLTDCKMKFSKSVTKTRQEPREVTVNLPNNSDIIVQFDSSGSFGGTGVASVKATVLAWFLQFKLNNPSFQGRLLYVLANQGCNGQSWLRILNWLQNTHNVFLVDDAGVQTPITNFNNISKNIVIVSTVNEAAINNCGGCGTCGEYHQSGISNPTPGPSQEYINDFNDYFNRYDNLKSLGYNIFGLQYPIVYSHSSQGPTKGMLQHSISAIVGETLGATEIATLMASPNVFVPIVEYSVLLDALDGPNPYPKSTPTVANPTPRSLRDIGWQYKHTRGWNGNGDIIPVSQFTQDIELFLGNLTSVETVMVDIPYLDIEYKYIDGEVLDNPVQANNSWTMSYSLKQNNWVSWHSYLPNFYINVPDKFYSWIYGNNYIWKHNRVGHYQTFYDKLNPFILEYVSLSNPLTTRLWEYLMLLVEVKKFDKTNNEFVDINNVFFNKLLAYNSRQCSGVLNIKVKDANELSDNYLYEQISNLDNNEIIVDRNERNWTINELRDIRTNYNESIFISDLISLQSNYFMDKILNNNSVNYNKDWSELESFRDKYLVVRLIFDNFAVNNEFENGSIKMLMNFSGENETQSFR